MNSPDTTPERFHDSVLRRALRWVAAALFIAAGLNHFRNPAFYASIVPPMFPSPRLLVMLSGVFEVAGGFGLLVPPLRRVAGCGLILLLIAVFPANIFMALSPERFGIARWLLWLRLPLQLVFVAWVWWVALAPRTRRAPRPNVTLERDSH